MRKFGKVFLIGWILAALLLGGCAGESAGNAAGDDPAPAATDGAPTEEEPSAAPVSFEGTDMEGNAVSSSILAQSKLTMINVWATFCNPCLREMPDLGQLAEAYDAEDFQLIGIVSDVLEGDDQSLAESLIQQTGANYTHLLLNESIYSALLTEVTAVPTTFFLDAEGNILDSVRGAKEKAVWEEIINGLLEGL